MANICFFDTTTDRWNSGQNPDTPNVADKLLQAAFQTSSPSEVRVGGLVTTTHDASGFVLDKANHVATNAHVALGGRSLYVLTRSGQKLDATIDKLDIANDVAILNVPGLNKTNAPPVTLASADAASPGKGLFAVGTIGFSDDPHGLQCISHGAAVRTDRLSSIWNSADMPKGPEQFGAETFREMYLKRHYTLAGQELLAHSDAYKPLIDRFMRHPVLFTNTAGASGMSGGPVSSDDGKVVGQTFGVKGLETLLATPISVVSELASKPSRFSFKYEQEDRAGATRGSGGPKLQQIVATDESARAETRLANIMLLDLQNWEVWPDPPKFTRVPVK